MKCSVISPLLFLQFYHVSSWKLAWLECKHRLGFPEVIDDIPGTIHLLRLFGK